jgi:hypothetical protein
LSDGGSKNNSPGPGTYETRKTLEDAPSSKFGHDQRKGFGATNNPGPGEHSPEFQKILNSAPKYGFGSETRNANSSKALGPGPGGYKLNALIGNEGQKHTMHSTIDYSPEKKENI